MKSIIKLTCIMMALLSMLVIAGCSNKPDYTGTWIGYDGENCSIIASQFRKTEKNIWLQKIHIFIFQKKTYQNQTFCSIRNSQ